MTVVGYGLLATFLFVLGSMTYAYRYRGKIRYESLGEYIRKGWPVFTPLNCLLYMFTQPRARKPIANLEEFHELNVIRDNWEMIREEALQLYQQHYFEQTKNPDSNAYYDIGFRTFFKYGWSKFYLNWYGYTHDSAKKLCPKTVALLETVPSVNGAMFSLLPVDSQLTRHLDPIACSLRYHLGLHTPNSDDCFINIDGNQYSWRNGEALLFDETFIHYARNDSPDYRLILMCDIDRPMSFIGRAINFFCKGLLRMTVVPNTDQDRRGFANALFSGLAPFLQKLKTLKQTNRKAYRLVKYTINFTLLLLAAGVIAGLFKLISGLGTLLAG
ncbi:MAG: aspartyl/asparaginyl beta-hydroxylase domain-containing protein [Nitrospinaceae bacterium]|nr:aspartyl/asparaginyl beta-hydroxylase domain-containing protein [Nitrospinaceae bacterium]NIR57548.1 aspartyl/asparaginyl beta-hydroxylase domain-containing protein [Nitrospinaceae bacterium]NIS88018.1 aspartyl/asparaginyl beta-hydroxylase domain-containing protein [Nitrospinaceae bacterium]NIT84882.1 aspartyl/asparaginyl beta-hydroxylase domain-containing protein [Nitrospinaceae bacterium]NIU47058.1 aspartyl/asparaginyl beta-hydroxylase domain-containing protein [Nitrospinaceae bacterium]